jgi:hypothetical protein
LACLAIFPVSIETFDPCRSISTVCDIFTFPDA